MQEILIVFGFILLIHPFVQHKNIKSKPIRDPTRTAGQAKPFAAPLPKRTAGLSVAAGPAGVDPPGRSVPAPHASCRAEESSGSAARTGTHSHASST